MERIFAFTFCFHVSNPIRVLILHQSSSCILSLLQYHLQQSSLSPNCAAEDSAALLCNLSCYYSSTSSRGRSTIATAITCPGSKCAEHEMYFTDNWAFDCSVFFTALRWCCVSTACSGIQVWTCLAMSAQLQQVGGNSSSSGTCIKVTMPHYIFFFHLDNSSFLTLHHFSLYLNNTLMQSDTVWISFLFILYIPCLCL